MNTVVPCLSIPLQITPSPSPPPPPPNTNDSKQQPATEIDVLALWTNIDWITTTYATTGSCLILSLLRLQSDIIKT